MRKTSSRKPNSASKPKRRREVQRPPRLEDALKLEDDDAAVLRQIADYYHEKFKATPAASEYLIKRGLTAPEIVEHFRIGFCDQSLSTVLPEKSTKLGREVRERLVRLGLIVGGREQLLGCVVVPLFDEHGNVVNLYGRRISPPASKSTPVHYRLNRHGLFNPSGLQSKEVILTQSIIDALTFWCAGFESVTGIRDTDDFTRELLPALKRYGTERVLIAFHGGSDHDIVVENIGDELKRAGILPYRIDLPTGVDVNDYARKFKPADRSLALLIKKARAMVDGAPVIVMPPARVEGPLVAREPEPVGSAAPTTVDPVAVTSPEPATAQAAEAKVEGDQVVLEFESRRYRARGLRKNLSYDVLRVNLLVARGEDLYFVDTLDLYSAKQRASFVKQAAAEIAVDEEVVKKDLGKVLMKLEALQHERIRSTLAPRGEAPRMTPAEHDEALDLLRDPNFLDRVLADFERCGVVGEEINKLLGYIAATSRKLEDPLAVIVQSSSAAGKTSLMESILAMMPEEDRVKFTAVSPKSLFYLGEGDLTHKILAVVEEEGAVSASYPLKLLQSEKELTIATAGSDSVTGKRVTEQYVVRGPVMIFLTTTAIDLDPELANRAFVLAVDEDRAQTRAIHEMQRRRETLDGLLQRETRERVLRLHRNAQRLLRPLCVVNEYAERLRYVDHSTRTRRDHGRYLALIRAIALLRQYQRPIRTVMVNGELREYITVELDDIAVANRLAHQVLGRSLDDLAPQTRALLTQLHRMADELSNAKAIDRSAFRFGRREIREYTGWSYDAVRVHLERLLALEYVRIESGGRGKSHVYELLYDGNGVTGEPFLVGLIDVGQLRTGSDETLVPSNPGRGETLGCHWSASGGPLESGKNGETACDAATLPPSAGDERAENSTPDRQASHEIGSGEVSS